MRTQPIFNIAKIATIALLFCSACSGEDPAMNTVPEITFDGINALRDVNGKDSAIDLLIGFTDGDGDIGLSPNDTLPPFNAGSPYNHNLPITIYYRDTADFQPLLNQNDEPVTFHERVPDLTPEGKNKLITGQIVVHLPADPLGLKPTEMKYEVNLIDRALNVSNTIETPVIRLEH